MSRDQIGQLHYPKPRRSTSSLKLPLGSTIAPGTLVHVRGGKPGIHRLCNLTIGMETRPFRFRSTREPFRHHLLRSLT